MAERQIGVFVSYAREDQPLVGPLVGPLLERLVQPEDELTIRLWWRRQRRAPRDDWPGELAPATAQGAVAVA